MKHSDPAIERLAKVPLFAACTPAELRLISQKTTEIRLHAGQVLAGEGHSGHEFVVLVEGKAKVMVGEVEVAVLGPGEFFGEVALLDDGPRTATVIAVTDVVADVSDKREFQELVMSSHTVAYKLLVGLAHRLRMADLRLS